MRSVSDIAGRRRCENHGFLMRLEELVMCIENAIPIFDELVEEHGDKIAQITWNSIKNKMTQIQKEDAG